MGFQDSLFSKYVTVISVVALYWFVSISLVFINKYLLSNEDFKIDAPLFITCFQCIVTVLLCHLLSFFTELAPGLFTFPDITLDTETSKKVFPLSIIFVAMITFNNLCLKNVGVPFYYIGRSLTTVFNVILTFTILHQKVSIKAIVCCIVIISGFVLGVEQEGVAGSLSISGAIYGVLASFFVSLFSVHVKKVLPLMDGSIWKLTYYNNVNAILLFLPLILLFGETKTIMNFQFLFHSSFWAMMMLGGTFGFAIGYVTGLQIKVTSPLTHNISGTAKACTQTVVAVMWFNEIKSILWWVSNMVVLLGSAAYTRVQQIQMKKDHEESTLPKKSDKGSAEQNV